MMVIFFCSHLLYTVNMTWPKKSRKFMNLWVVKMLRAAAEAVAAEWGQIGWIFWSDSDKRVAQEFINKWFYLLLGVMLKLVVCTLYYTPWWWKKKLSHVKLDSRMVKAIFNISTSPKKFSYIYKFSHNSHRKSLVINFML